MAVARQTKAAALGELKAPDLEHFDMLRHLPRDQVDDLIRRSTVSTLLAGEPLIQADPSPRRMYLLLSGRLHVHLRSTGGEPTAALLPGQTLGELAILDQWTGLDPGSADTRVVAAEPSRVLVVSEESLWNLLGSSHAFALNLLLKLAERLRHSSESISQNTALRERFERAALFDPLTNVNNRRWLESALPRLVDRHSMDRRSLALALIDIDGFGQLNERFGPSIGDRLLTAVAITLRSRLRPSDQIARHGGGRFALVLPETNLCGAQGTADRVRDAIRTTRPFGLVPADLPQITCSIGLAELQPSQSASSLLSRAEAALHRAKQAGPDSCAA